LQQLIKIKMESLNRHEHWENIYMTKQLCEVGWYQKSPSTSLEFLNYFNISMASKIIDVGGGDSFFVDDLLDLGYQDITVLDISETAIRRAKERLDSKADKVKWIVSDIVTFIPTKKYDFWHDRATFHFLLQDDEIEKYIHIAEKSIISGGILVLGTFSEEGPKKCSGIEIKQYSETSMSARLKKSFKKINCIIIDHTTPFNTVQNYIFCSFRKL
jgi:2-polyprenyl-3-methyl-5-hydroxy-6-metoxy-1,4-benzoquinol methylase